MSYSFEVDMKAKISEKGVAALAAINAGICPKNLNGYDMSNFEKFWNSFIDGLLKQRANGRNDFGNLGDKISGCNAYKSIDKFKSMLFTFIAIFFGFLIGFFF